LLIAFTAAAFLADVLAIISLEGGSTTATVADRELKVDEVCG